MDSEAAAACASSLSNNSTTSNCSSTTDGDGGTNVVFEYFVRIIIPIIFGLIAVLGLVGNLSVIVVVVANKTMRNTTNILIIGLAAADLVFIVVCVPFTAVIYVIPVWPFGLVWCKVGAGWLCGPAVEHRSLAGVLSLSCARLAADG